MDFTNGKISGGVVAGVVLIAIGALLFLDNLRIISLDLTDMFWPVLFCVWGLSGVCRSRRLADFIWPVTLLVAATVLFLSSLGVLPRHISFFSLWPLALIAAGLMTITSGVNVKELASRLTPGSTANMLHEVAIFSGVKREVSTPAFEGGTLSSVFGGIEIDLRWASMAVSEVVVEANAVFGGIEMRVPDTWRVLVQGFAVFGAYENKTQTSRREPLADAPVLIVRGNTAFGGVSVRN